MQLTQSGHDSAPQWSPDSRWIAFLSERKAQARAKTFGRQWRSDHKDANDKDGDNKDASDNAAQFYLISPGGGEAFAITSGSEEVHALRGRRTRRQFTLPRASRGRRAKGCDDNKKDWKDVIHYRGDERGDVIFRDQSRRGPGATCRTWRPGTDGRGKGLGCYAGRGGHRVYPAAGG